MNVCKKLAQNLVLVLLVLFSASCAFDGRIHRSEAEADPFESINRPIFEFNYQFDKYILKPLAKGYRAITNQFIRERIHGIITNIKEPISMVNHLLQADPKATVVSLNRFVINSTLGLAGMFDVADGWGLKKEETGFNATLAHWCIKDGPYIVLPFWGPSTPRATVGLIADGFANPVYWATLNDANVRDKIIYSYAAVSSVSMREAALDIGDDLERNSVDFYATMRSAYLQNQSKLRCFNDDGSAGQTYDFDFGIEEEDAAFDEMEEE